MEKGDVLVVTKLDRLRCDAVDDSTTVAKLEKWASASIAWPWAGSISPVLPGK